MFPRLLRKLKLNASIRNKIAILFVFSCCATSVFYLLSKIQATTNEYKRRSIYTKEKNNELYLISKFLYIYNDSIHIDNRNNFNVLNLIFLTKRKEQIREFLCVSKNHDGEIFKSKLNLSLLDLLTKDTFLHQGKCEILANYASFFIETNKETIEIEAITEIIHVPMKLDKRSVCILPLFLYSNIENLKNVIEYYKRNMYNFVNIYVISFKKDVNPIINDKFNFVKNTPWFIFNRKENINSLRNFHTISLTKNNLIESMKSAIYDCYFRYKDISKEIVFLNLNNYLPNGTSYSHIDELFVPPLVLSLNNQNATKNENRQILKNVNFNIVQSNNTDVRNSYINVIQTGECYCTNECNDICDKFNEEKILQIDIKNNYKKEKTTDKKVMTMNDFDLTDTEYFEIMLSNKCSHLFQKESLFIENNVEESNRVRETFDNFLRYFKDTQPVEEEKRCYMSLLLDNISCTVSNLSFNNLINMTNVHLPFNDTFVSYEDGCHF
uniref:Glycosyltransferase family 61 protein n=1 Tax=Strongyloides papillosus TaxID=174720 RepID=A0A0N5CFE4_STREA